MPSGFESTYDSSCLNQTDEPITVVALWPHMHDLGTRARVELAGADGALAGIFDHPFRSDANVHYGLEPRVVVQPGEKLRTSCTYFNSTPNRVAMGISLVQELCYQLAFSYPAGALDKPGNLSLIGATNTCWGD